MPTRLVHLVIDAADPARLARFWAAALGWEIGSRGGRRGRRLAARVQLPRPGGAAADVRAGTRGQDRQEPRAPGPGHRIGRAPGGRGGAAARAWARCPPTSARATCPGGAGRPGRQRVLRPGSAAGLPRHRAGRGRGRRLRRTGRVWRGSGRWPRDGCRPTRQRWSVAPVTAGVGPYLELLPSADAKTVKNRVHLDVAPASGRGSRGRGQGADRGGRGARRRRARATSPGPCWPTRKATSSACCRPGDTRGGQDPGPGSGRDSPGCPLRRRVHRARAVDQAALRPRRRGQLRAGPDGGGADGLARSRPCGGRAGRRRAVQLGQHPPRLGSQGRVHGIQGGGEQAFVIDAAGQIAERLRDWSMPAERRRAARRGCRPGAPTAVTRGGSGAGSRARFGGDEVAAWRHCEQALTPLRPRIRQLARALLVHPRHLPYQVAAAIADSA